MNPFLVVKDLTLGLTYKRVPLVEKVSFEVKKGEVLGVLGESGCGKTLTGFSLLRLFPPGISYYSGEVWIDGIPIYSLKEKELCQIRGKKVAIILQDPLSSLNPVLSIKEQLEEVLKAHRPDLTKKERFDKMLNLLKEVGISDPEIRLKSYPHQLSGGLRQRIMIAIALAGDPEILVADEPTTAIDPTLQIQVLNLLKRLNRERGLTIVFISHDLGVIRWIAHRVAVFYAGEIVELAPVERLFLTPLHPYTQALINSYPKEGKFKVDLKGGVVELSKKPEGCYYQLRCDNPCEKGKTYHPQLLEVVPQHWVRCFRYE
ncbi:MAG: Oligopeptide/dipeptide ABC transporter, ATPase subunit [Thermodesulfobacterium sp. 37_54]|uniref:Peptide ABC transporter ATP-binding protein n=1 Tax=Thermodesulfobacterium commune TaxID=1741 RepID=A0A101FIP1_9BACT|nr:ABC transporter ATP-binding protein [Thermodesulfobacterium sp.]KUJ97756.1 MAG: Oligopeptide/dipeptide ABC transporter, ATPase subunit [Thermodesulfobacterium sp. 37_54]KUK19575.1 MAG: Oligopeptide/dipeptide ABC transporter, ATPase subunit [Thermodesulfobacterium commune]KUK37759.1 MAG: Oligopeptide/dipeptide ABC transporter, ATPase subunit [Thermodesulfobacterium commune]MDN5380377.1 peptide/nickel transport system ATP-binding protein [Thermodesulfobacterium sp.]HAA83502.1 peptide ABC tran